jgi:guanylate kinase
VPDTLSTLPSQRGLLLVVSGPSAVGKDTVLDALMSSTNLPHPILKCVTATTRDPRPTEKDGVDYFFLSAPRFHAMVAAGEFIEYADVHGFWYGTPRTWVEERLRAGDDVILKIDVQGALSVRQLFADAILVFLQPPSLEELERRLRQRRSENEDAIARRLLNARSEMARRGDYDYAITNDEIDLAVDGIRAIVIAEHARIRRASEPVKKVNVDG